MPIKSFVEIYFLILFRMVPIGSFYLGASSTTPSSASFGRPQSTPSSAGWPPQTRFEPTLEQGSDDPGSQRVQLERAGSVTSVESKRKSRGIINPEFKFPPSPSTSPAASYAAPGLGAPHASPAVIQPDLQRRGSPPTVIEDQSSLKGERNQDDEASRPAVVTPSSIEVPAPPLVEKERTATRTSLDDLADDDVGDTVDIPLN